MHIVMKIIFSEVHRHKEISQNMRYHIKMHQMQKKIKEDGFLILGTYKEIARENSNINI